MNQFPHEYDDDDAVCVHCRHDGAEEHWLHSQTHPDDREPKQACYCPVRKSNVQTFFPDDDWDDE